MQIVSYNKKLDNNIVLAMGFFDCMHLGHLRLLDSAKSMADKYSSSVGIMTFANNHFAQLGKDTKLLYSYNERLDIYRNNGVDIVVSCQFDQHFMSLSAQEFLDQLFANIPIAGLVIGYDHYCGRDRQGSEFIREYCRVKGIECIIIDQVEIDNTKISSTLIRDLIIDCQFELANRLLSQPYHISGRVVHGRGVGRTIGYPTANISVDSDKLLPNGVFSARIVLGNKLYCAVVNIGSAPTFGVDKSNIEMHIIDYNEDLYGQFVEVCIVSRIRPIRHFDTIEELKKQIARDIEVTNDKIRP